MLFNIQNQELDDDEVIVIEPDPENPRCLSCGEEQSNQSTMIRCDDCDSFFHASCVNFNIDQQLNDKKQSICPLCNHKGSPMSHMAKLVQVVTFEVQTFFYKFVQHIILFFHYFFRLSLVLTKYIKVQMV